MPRATYRQCKYCGSFHNVADWPDNHRDPEPQRSHLPAPGVIGDTMDGVQSMLDGKIYDSKSALRATYKQAGVVEVGNDSSVLEPKAKPKPAPDRQGIKAALGKAFSQVGLGA